MPAGRCRTRRTEGKPGWTASELFAAGVDQASPDRDSVRGGVFRENGSIPAAGISVPLEYIPVRLRNRQDRQRRSSGKRGIRLSRDQRIPRPECGTVKSAENLSGRCQALCGRTAPFPPPAGMLCAGGRLASACRPAACMSSRASESGCRAAEPPARPFFQSEVLPHPDPEGILYGRSVIPAGSGPESCLARKRSGIRRSCQGRVFRAGIPRTGAPSCCFRAVRFTDGSVPNRPAEDFPAHPERGKDLRIRYRSGGPLFHGHFRPSGRFGSCTAAGWQAEYAGWSNRMFHQGILRIWPQFRSAEEEGPLFSSRYFL